MENAIVTSKPPERAGRTKEDLESLALAGELVGTFDDISIDAYHAGPGVSSTDLRALLVSPAHYRAHQLGETDSKAKRFGRLAHSAVLEPERFAATTIDAPAYKFDGRSKEGKAERQEFLERAKGREVISADDAINLRGIVDAFRSSQFAQRIIAGGPAEVSCYWINSETGLLCKARADKLGPDSIFDLKTATSAAPRAFSRSIADYRYHVAAAFYLDGFSSVGNYNWFKWLVVEKEPPYALGYYTADAEAIAIGRDEYRFALRRLAECLASNNWPGFAEEFNALALPAWYQRVF